MILLLVAIFSLFATGFAEDGGALSERRCGYNEQWYSIDNRHGGCDPTCDEPNKECRGIVAGCFCRPGYVRNEYDICIPQYLCYYDYRRRSDIPNTDTERTCGLNEVWDFCNCGDYTCENPKKKNKVCISCIPGCYCDEGYVRNSHNECIELKQCFECGENEEYSNCRKGCDGTCNNRYPDCFGCIGGCVCKKGDVRDHNERCIPFSWCFY